MEINTSNVLNGKGKAGTTGAKLADDFDAFLSLLTTQLANQDPLEPLDSNEFTTQLVQFAGVEQQISQNANLESIISLTNQNTQVAALGYIGKEIQALGNKGALVNGEMKLSYATIQKSDALTIQILDSDGQVVRTVAVETPQTGPQQYVWDGKDDAGTQLEDGVYTIEVNATTHNNQTDTDDPIDVITGMIGTVTSVNADNGTIFLGVGKLLIDTATLVSVSQLQPPPSGGSI